MRGANPRNRRGNSGAGRAFSKLLILNDFVAVDEVCRELVSVDGKKQRFFEK